MASKATITTDHDEIRRWAETRGGQPAAIKTGKRGGGAGILRIDFPRGKKLPHVSWDDWFATFDKSHLGFLHSDEGRFNKLVSLDEKKRARGPASRRAHAASGTKGRATMRGANRTTRTARGHAPARRTGRSRTGE